MCKECGTYWAGMRDHRRCFMLYGTELCNAIGISAAESTEGAEYAEGGTWRKAHKAHHGCNSDTVEKIAERHCRSNNIRPR
jgi:hypothetical protein